MATATLVLLFAAGARAQTPPVTPPPETIAFDRPESWALKYFVAATTLTPLAPPETRPAGSLTLELEAGWIPRLSDSQRRVGFEGTALEDVNKTPVLARPRLGIWLPGGVLAEVAWLPPVEIRGEKTNLVSGALERTLVEAPGAALGLRLWGQLGHSKGDITCTDEDAAHPAGSPQNPLGCEGPSSDTATLNAAGAALTAGFRAGPARFHAAAGATYNDVQFQVGAVTNGFHDSTILRTHGWTGWGAAGVTFPIGPADFGVEAFYSPLTVRRPPDTSSKNDGLFNVRALIRVPLR